MSAHASIIVSLSDVCYRLLLFCIRWFRNVRLLAETTETIQLCLYLVQFCELFLFVQSCCTLYESFTLVFNIFFLSNSRELSFSSSLCLYAQVRVKIYNLHALILSVYLIEVLEITYY
jgi:hypothetical protein